MRKPGTAPSSIKEHCGEGVRAGEPSIVAKLIPALQDLVIKRGPLTMPDAANAPELQAVREVIKALNIGSLLALPLTDGAQQMGVIILAQALADLASQRRGRHQNYLRSSSNRVEQRRTTPPGKESFCYR